MSYINQTTIWEYHSAQYIARFYNRDMLDVEGGVQELKIEQEIGALIICLLRII